MSTVFGIERWPRVRAEMMPLLHDHWLEIGMHHDMVPLDIDDDRYCALEEAGDLRILTARRAGVLIGYHVTIVSTHLHYRSTLCGFTDVYYLRPKHRHGVTAINLFEAVDRDLAEVKVARGFAHMKRFTAVKEHFNQASGLLQYMGYVPTEQLFTRII